MQFHALVEEIRILSLNEKEEVRTLLDRFLAEERREEIAAHHREAQRELAAGKLKFSGDLGELRGMLGD